MTISRCRVCGQDLFIEPLLRYENMPKCAQYLPDKKSIESERGVKVEVCQCSGCGLVQLNNEPVTYYKKVIRAVGISEEMKEFRTNQFMNFIQKYELEEKKVIEIGCGCGEYLSIMQQCGADAFGLEYLLESVNICIEKGMKVEKGFIDNPNAKLNRSPFDAFYILNFLEHLPDINLTLRGIFNNLKDNAIGLIEVPNFDKVHEKNLFSEFICDHLFYFTKDTLKNTLQLNGFELLECKEVWHDYIISAVVKKRSKLNITHFYDYQEKIKKEIYDYIGNFDYKEVAIWGAGHQALAVMSLTCLDDKIKYVIDSAPFKQGKYTPATHIPIVSPDEFKTNPVEAIIVIADGYSDEIVRNIRNKFCGDIKVAILRDFGLEVV